MLSLNTCSPVMCTCNFFRRVRRLADRGPSGADWGQVECHVLNWNEKIGFRVPLLMLLTVSERPHWRHLLAADGTNRTFRSDPAGIVESADHQDSPECQLSVGEDLSLKPVDSDGSITSSATRGLWRTEVNRVILTGNHFFPLHTWPWEEHEPWAIEMFHLSESLVGEGGNSCGETTGFGIFCCLTFTCVRGEN